MSEYYILRWKDGECLQKYGIYFVMAKSWKDCIHVIQYLIRFISIKLQLKYQRLYCQWKDKNSFDIRAPLLFYLSLQLWVEREAEIHGIKSLLFKPNKHFTKVTHQM